MILVGYHSTGGYKLDDAINKRIIISRDVIFKDMKDYKNAKINSNGFGTIHVVFENIENASGEIKVEENVRRSKRHA